jgi:hypothetical protein
LRRFSFEKMNKKSGIQDFKKSSKSTSSPQVLHAPRKTTLLTKKKKRKKKSESS